MIITFVIPTFSLERVLSREVGMIYSYYIVIAIIAVVFVIWVIGIGTNTVGSWDDGVGVGVLWGPCLHWDRDKGTVNNQGQGRGVYFYLWLFPLVQNTKETKDRNNGGGRGGGGSIDNELPPPPQPPPNNTSPTQLPQILLEGWWWWW